MDRQTNRSLQRDLKTLVRFIGVYCDGRHADRSREPARLATHNVQELAGKPLVLCESCRKLLAHALIKRTRCPLAPKPACKHCPSHCYHPAYRAQIREVMKYSGRRLVLHGRLDYLIHLLF